MGKITNLKTSPNDKVTITLELTQKEAMWLKGNLENIHIFSENNLEYTTRLVQRGKRESTKYFLIPKDLRKKIMISNSIKCNMIETNTKCVYVFSTNKY